MEHLLVSPTTEAEVLAQAIAVLTAGGVVIFPTETCYGIAVDATNPEAVGKLLAYKGKRGNKAISIAVADQNMAKAYVEINELAETLYSTLLPGPITVVSKDKGKVARQLVSDMGTLGVRIPDYPFAVRLVNAFGSPITATSANTSGKKPPYSFEDWVRYTAPNKQEMVVLFIDVGQLPYRAPSTVVDTTLNEPKVLRQGEIVIPEKESTTLKTRSVEETQAVAASLVNDFKEELKLIPVVIAMQGEMGAGKTHFVKGLAKALNVAENVPSPTYTLMREYEIRTGMLYHIDTWRMHSGADLEALGLDELTRPGNVIAIEWAQKVKPEVERLTNKAKVIWMDITAVNETDRVIRYSNVDVD